jgi:hypothetical protein
MNQVIRIKAIRLTTLATSLLCAPKTIRLFVNNVTMGFDDAESLEPAQEVILTEAQAKGEEAIQLRFVRFQSVTALSIFVLDNQDGGDVTRIDKIELIGVGVDTSDMKTFAKVEHED